MCLWFVFLGCFELILVWYSLTSGWCCSCPVVLLLCSARCSGAQSPHLYITALSCVLEFLQSSSGGIPRVIQVVAGQVSGHGSCSTSAIHYIKVTLFYWHNNNWRRQSDLMVWWNFLWSQKPLVAGNPSAKVIPQKMWGRRKQRLA